MIKTNFDEISLAEYKQCLAGNTIVLHKGFYLFKSWIKLKTDSAFIDISDRLNDAMQSDKGNLVIKMWNKINQNSIRLQIYMLSYKVQSLVKDDENIVLLAENGFKYNHKISHIDNLKVLAGKIDRLNKIVNDLNVDFVKITTQKEENKSTLEEIIMTINNAATCNLSMNSTLADFIAANKLLTKLENNRKNK